MIDELSEPLTSHWTAVVIELTPGVLAVKLFFDGEPVEVIDEPDDVLDYLRALSACRRPSRSLAGVDAVRPPLTRNGASRISSAVSPAHSSATSWSTASSALMIAAR